MCGLECSNLILQAHFGGDHTDALYIPARLSADFVLGAMAFREKGVMHEMAVPAIFGIICADASEFEVKLFLPKAEIHLCIA